MDIAYKIGWCLFLSFVAFLAITVFSGGFKDWSNPWIRTILWGIAGGVVVVVMNKLRARRARKLK